MNDEEIHHLFREMASTHDVTDWHLEIVDEIDEPEGAYGFTDRNKHVIYISRHVWPTDKRNIVELLKHEIAHALLPHGYHDVDWWYALRRIGGTGIWYKDDGEVAPWSWSLEAIQRLEKIRNA